MLWLEVGRTEIDYRCSSQRRAWKRRSSSARIALVDTRQHFPVRPRLKGRRSAKGTCRREDGQVMERRVVGGRSIIERAEEEERHRAGGGASWKGEHRATGGGRGSTGGASERRRKRRPLKRAVEGGAKIPHVSSSPVNKENFLLPYNVVVQVYAVGYRWITAG